MRKVLMLDNYDSFTYNLVQYLLVGGVEVDVRRNDEISVEEALQYREVVLSPGPGLPGDAGIMSEYLTKVTNQKVLGVCLGHQAIAESEGGVLYNQAEVHHGVATRMKREAEDPLFKDIPQEFLVGRYHSWAVAEPLPDSLQVLARDIESGTVMAFTHRTRNLKGVQFHPESILTDFGLKLIQNWLAIPVSQTNNKEAIS